MPLKLLRAVQALLATLLVLLALYVSLGRELAPELARYHLEIEQAASQALGKPVRVGKIQGAWQGLAPLLVLEDISLGDQASALHLAQLKVVPALWRSIWSGRPQLAAIEISGLALELREQADGRWQVQGMESPAHGASADWPQLFTALLAVPQINLVDSRLLLEPLKQKPLSFTYLNASLALSPSEQRLDLRLVLPDGQPLAAQLTTAVDLNQPLNSPAKLYLSAPSSDWAQWLPDQLLTQWHLAEFKAGGELWLNWQNAKPQQAALRLNIAKLRGGLTQVPEQTIEDLSLLAQFELGEQGYRFILNDLALNLDNQRFGPVSLGVRHERENSEHQARWQILADRLDLAPLAQLAEHWLPLPELGREVLSTLNPRGVLRQVNAQWRPQAAFEQRLSYSAALEDVAVDAWHSAPSGSGISGRVSGDLLGGELALASRDFTLHFPHLFPKPWAYQQANARVGWRINAESVTIYSPVLRLQGDEGAVSGDFLARVMLDHQAESYMDLRVGLRNGQAAFAKKYLPTQMSSLSPALGQWLNSAIVKAQIKQGYFQYQGALNKPDEPAAHVFNLYFDVADATLDYQAGWPALQQGQGEVWVDNTGVQVRLDSGQVSNTQVRWAKAKVPHAASGEVPTLALAAELTGGLQDGLAIVQKSPLPVAELAQWRAQGPLSAALNLTIPLGQGRAPGGQVDWHTEQASLNMPELNLALSNLSGAFRFDLAKGLSAESLKVQVLNHEVRGQIFAEGQAGQLRSRIQLQGRAPLAPVAKWLNAPSNLPLSGSLAYQLQINLEGSDSLLRIDSSLEGLAIDLPAPFGKLARTRRPTEWRMTLAGAQRRYQLSQSNLFDLRIQAAPGALLAGRGELRLGEGQAKLPVTDSWRLRGYLPDLDLEAWRTSLNKLGVSQGVAGWQPNVALRIGRVHGYGLAEDDLYLEVNRGAGGWNLSLDGSRLKGTLGKPDDPRAPWVVRLERLNLPQESSDAEQPAQDPLQGLDPHLIPALDVEINQLKRGDRTLGRWAFKALPQADGVLFDELSLGLPGMLLAGQLRWQGDAQRSQSSYQGRAGGSDLNQVLSGFGFAPSLSSSEFHFDLAGNWPGSPAFFSLKRYSGSLDLSLKHGQLQEVEGGAQALRVFGLLNMQSIRRRLRLDFSDLLSKGLAYDRLKGRLQGQSGVFVTQKPLRLEGPSSDLSLEGTLDMARDRIDAKLAVTLPVSNNLALAALMVGAPAVGGALLVFDQLLGDQVAKVASVRYHVNGPWEDPKITFLKPNP